MMLYSTKVKEVAFDLFCQDLSAVKIARRIPELFGDEVRPHPRTIENWITKGDWPARRRGIRQEAGEIVDRQRVRTTAELLAGLIELREKILIAGKEGKFRTAEGAVRSLATVQGIIDNLTLSETDTISQQQLEEVVGTIFQVLANDEVLGPILAKRQTHILKCIEEQLAGGPVEGS